MKFLITGASGFVGRHLTQHLLTSNHEVAGVGHALGKDPLGEFHVLDMLNADAVHAFDFRPYDGVFHLAGLAAVGASFEHPEQYITSNSAIEINLCEAILAQQAKPRVLVISTGGVYDPAELPLTESSPLNPTNPYAVSKITQELLATYYANRGIDTIVVRPFNHIGPGQNEGFLVADLAKQIVEATQQHSAIQVGNLTSERDFTDVRDIVRAYALIILKGKPRSIYNVCSGKPRSGQEILDTLIKISGAEITIEQDPDRVRPSEHHTIYGSYAKLQQDTGWEPSIACEDTLRDVLEDWRQRV